MAANIENVVIVGASAAGVTAAMTMRQSGFEGKIALVDADPHLPYERPPLSKALMTADSGAALKPIVTESEYADQGIDLMLGTGVASLDADRRRVTLANRDWLPADSVLIATGVSARRLDVPGADLRNIFSLRTAADASAISTALAQGGPLVVVGGGFIGLELAALARQHGIDVTVVELQDIPLGPILGQRVAELVKTLHEDRGVRLVLGSTVDRFRGADGQVSEVVLTTGQTLEAAVVVVGVGVVTNDRLATEAGVAVDGGIVVDSCGRTNVPWIYAAGDVAAQSHAAIPGRGRIEHWDSAMRLGAAAGSTMIGKPQAYDALPYVWSDQYDLTMHIFGRPQPTHRLVLRDGAEPHRFVAFWLHDDRVKAVLGFDSPREARAARVMIESDVAVDDAALQNRETDLTKLSRELRKQSSRV